METVSVRMPAVRAVCDLKRTNLTKYPSVLHDFSIASGTFKRPERLKKPLDHRFNGLPMVMRKSQSEEPGRAIKMLNSGDCALNLKDTPGGNLDRADWTDPVTSTNNKTAVKSASMFT
jgi:hypothetical protein